MIRGNRHTLVISETIVRPLTKTSLNNDDVLFHYAKAYRELIQNDYIGSSKRETVKRNYKRAENEIRTFFSDYYWIHLDDLDLTVDYFYPPYELEQYLDERGIGRFYLEHIFRVASCFITFRDGQPSIKYWSKDNDRILAGYSEFDKIALWNDISRSCTTDLFIAALYCKYHVKPENLYDIPNIISLSDMPLNKVFRQGVAETHMHANAGLSQSFIWSQAMNHPKGYEKFFSPLEEGEYYFCRVFRLIAAEYIGKSDSDFREFYLCHGESDIIGWLLRFKHGEETYPTKTDVLDFERRIFDRYDISAPKKDQDILLQTYFGRYICSHTSGDILLYYYCLNRLEEDYDPVFCSMLLMYIRYKNLFFSDKIQQTRTKGLDYFQKIYDNATDVRTEQSKSYYYSIIEEQSRTGNLKVLEMKITPKIAVASLDMPMTKRQTRRNTMNQLKSIFQAYDEFINDYGFEQNYLNESRNIPQIGLIYHFIKKEDSDNFTGYHCPYYSKTDVVNCSDYLSMRKQSDLFVEVLKELLYECPVLTDYVVGIDAASVENKTEPWVFAPVFRKARSRKNTVPVSFEEKKRVQNIGFTYHVGEDFRHIASGLRHIDEVLEYFDYHSGDRIGHAIALGIDIDYWSKQSGMVAIPIAEYLDNLLWTWRYAHTGKISASSGNIEFKIMGIARELYGGCANNIDVHTLWRVYESKFSDYQECRQNKCNINELEPDKYTIQKLINMLYCPCFYEKYHRPIFVSTKEYLDIYKDIQELLIEKVEKKGIYVETNPSSNAIISDIQSIFDHPVIRLNNRGLSVASKHSAAVMVSVNSDDPIVFSTYTENELSYIYYELLNEGCGREEALEWIDKIRRHGLNSSFIKSPKTRTEILEDCKTIIDYCG